MTYDRNRFGTVFLYSVLHCCVTVECRYSHISNSQHTIPQVYIVRSRKEFHRSTFQDSKARKRAQDVSIARSAVSLTLGSGAAWAPSCLATLALVAGGTVLLEIGVWAAHILYWVAPILFLRYNTALRRALACLRMDIAKRIRRCRS